MEGLGWPRAASRTVRSSKKSPIVHTVSMNSRCRVLVRAAFLIVATGLITSTAGAEDRYRLELHVEAGGHGCPSANELRRRVEMRVGPVFDEAAQGRIDATVSRSGELWLAEIRVVDSNGSLSGSRRLEATSGDCEAIIEAVGFAIALALGPHRTSNTRSAKAQETTPASAPAAEVVPESRANPASATEDRAPTGQSASGARASRYAFNGSVGPLAAVGLLPSAGLGVRTRFSGNFNEKLTLAVSFVWLAEQQHETEAGRLLAKSWGGSVQGSYVLLEQTLLRWTTGVGVHAALLDLTVLSPDPLGPSEHLWLAVGPQTSLEFSVTGPVIGVASVDLLWTLSAREFGIQGGPLLAELSPVALSGFLGLGTRF